MLVCIVGNLFFTGFTRLPFVLAFFCSWKPLPYEGLQSTGYLFIVRNRKLRNSGAVIVLKLCKTHPFSNQKPSLDQCFWLLSGVLHYCIIWRYEKGKNTAISPPHVVRERCGASVFISSGLISMLSPKGITERVAMLNVSPFGSCCCKLSSCREGTYIYIHASQCCRCFRGCLFDVWVRVFVSGVWWSSSKINSLFFVFLPVDVFLRFFFACRCFSFRL